MKKILCFGDSNTYGYIPSSGKRYDKSTRWTGILSDISGFEIIEAGCNNRTGFVDNPAGIMQTGYKILPELLHSQLDVVILSIGINDLQIFYNQSMDDIKFGLENLIQITRAKSPQAHIIIAAPPQLNDNIFNGHFCTMFDRGSIAKSILISGVYKNIAREQNCHFIDLNEIATVSEKDGLHFTAEGHRKIADAFWETLQKL